MMPREPIDARAVLDLVDLADLVRKRGVVLKERSGKLSGCCPFHQEKTPSFYVFKHPRPGHFHCFGCGVHGDAIAFVRRLDGIGFLDAVEQLGGPQRLTEADRQRIRRQEAEAERRRAASQRAKLENAAEIYVAAGPAEGSPVEAYLRGRGIDLDAIGGIPGVLRCGQVAYHWLDERTDPRAPRAERYVVLATLPAMVAVIQEPNGSMAGVHVTWLEPIDGRWTKAELADPITGEILSAKKMLGRSFGGAIRLTLLGPTLRAGEGIETSLSVLAALRRAGRGDAVWALGSRGNLAGGGMGLGPKKPGTREVTPGGRVRWQRRQSPIPDPARPGFVPPPGVTRFIWLGDNDDKDPEDGRLVVERGLARYRALGIDASVAWAAPGSDFNDMARKPPGETE
ncbi:CHC2 zinc finger domain-containing protein [Inquilinus sp. CA228]|uniref:CHC2 zinc finger domain-containing protein n=1 Tax=Inquilinus sp. CA228 TaxID=3455609 RepID=UPI003F8D1F2E